MIQKATVEIEPLAPFDLASGSLVFAEGDMRVRSFRDGCFSQVIDVGDRLVWAKLTSESCCVDKPKLMLELYAEGACFSDGEKQHAVEVVNHVFSLNMPLEPFYSHVKGDFVMSYVARELRGLKFPTTPTRFLSRL